MSMHSNLAMSVLVRIVWFLSEFRVLLLLTCVQVFTYFCCDFQFCFKPISMSNFCCFFVHFFSWRRHWIENGRLLVVIQRSKKCVYRLSLIIQKLIWPAVTAWRRSKNSSKHLVSMSFIRWIWRMWKIYFFIMGSYAFYVDFDLSTVELYFTVYICVQCTSYIQFALNIHFLVLEMLSMYCQRPFFQISHLEVISTTKTIKKLLKRWKMLRNIPLSTKKTHCNNNRYWVSKQLFKYIMIQP